MSRRDQLIDPFADDGNDDDESRPDLTMEQAADALFGELNKRDTGRKTVQPISIFNVIPDAQQPRRTIPYQVRTHWSGKPKDVPNLFNIWLEMVNEEREQNDKSPFDLNRHLWAEAIEGHQQTEDQYEPSVDEIGAVERSFLRVIQLAVSIRRDGLANPVTLQRLTSNQFKLETGERRWLAYHMLFGYFDGKGGKPEERERWEKIPALVVDEFNVWRQASENAARADLNAIGRARQFAILMMDLLREQGKSFKPFDAMVKPGESDRAYYAQVVDERVPSGKSEMLLNGLGMSHRSAFSRCRTLLSLPDEVWTIADSNDVSEDELLRLSKLDPDDALREIKTPTKNVVSRNNDTAEPRTKKPAPSPALFRDPALKRGNRLFTKQNQLVVRELLSLKDGVGEAEPGTKQQIRTQIEIVRSWLDQLESALDSE